MPHECTACGRGFADGSKEMLSGCPDCGGTKFQFMPAGGAPAAEEPPDPPSTEAGTVTETVGAATTKLRDFVGDDPSPPSDAGAVGVDDGAAVPTEDTDTVGVDEGGAVPTDDTDVVGTDDADTSGSEDGAQSMARTEMVSTDELPGGAPSVGSAASEDDPPERAAGDHAGDSTQVPDDAEADARVVDTPSDETPDLSELREELNDQFEGIRISEPGQYELNLMELYEREETIIALQENGRYVIEPPESWAGDERV
jgi:predicted  nucleic acid-binding Zn-ribbon protein